MAIINNVFTQFPEDAPEIVTMLEYVSEAIKIANSVRKDADDGAFDGVGIASITFDAANKMTVTMTDGSTYVSPILKGETGATGPQGPQGPAGTDGTDGDDGVGISSIVFNDDYTMTITLTDGTTFSSGNLRGATGPQGPQGPQGPAGASDVVAVYNINETISIPAIGDNTVVTGRITLYENNIAHWVLKCENDVRYTIPAGGTGNQYLTVPATNGPFAYTHKSGVTNFNFRPVDVFYQMFSTTTTALIPNSAFTLNAVTELWTGNFRVCAGQVSYSTKVPIYIDIWGTYTTV